MYKQKNDTTNPEVWKDVKGYEGIYQVSDQGMVRSLDRLVNGRNGNQQKKQGKVLKENIIKNGYSYICLCKNSKPINTSTHRLIAKHFLPNVMGKHYINHKNGIKTDNAIRNLEWCTASENTRHGIANGLIKHGAGGFVRVDALEESHQLMLLL